MLHFSHTILKSVWAPFEELNETNYIANLVHLSTSNISRTLIDQSIRDNKRNNNYHVTNFDEFEDEQVTVQEPLPTVELPLNFIPTTTSIHF